MTISGGIRGTRHTPPCDVRAVYGERSVTMIVALGSEGERGFRRGQQRRRRDARRRAGDGGRRQQLVNQLNIGIQQSTKW